MGIKKIVIKTSSGYVGAEYAYSDKLVLTKDIVSYEFKPFIISERMPDIKWSYSPQKKMYTTLFSDICEMAERYCSTRFTDMVWDAGTVSISITYDNGKKQSEEFYCCPEKFSDLFSAINMLETSSTKLLGMKM